MFRPKSKLSHGMRNMSSSLLTLNEIESLGKSSDWRKNYIIKPKEIGRGHFSKVYHVSCDNRQLSFAAKVIRRRRGGVDRLEKIKEEAALIRKLNNLGVQSVIQLFETHENFSEVVLISELAKGGSLFTLIQESNSGLDPDYVKVVIFKLLLALEAMHKENIVHLDIKADNILLRDPYPSTDIALCDFGLATQLKAEKSHKELVGTPDYMAPEVINYEKISVNTDMWSVGVVVYYLLTGLSPFMGKSKDETLSNVSRVNITFNPIFSQPDYKVAKDFISSLCIKSPELRLSSTAAQKHAWFQNINEITVIDHKDDLVSISKRNYDLDDKEEECNERSYCTLPLRSQKRTSVDLDRPNISEVIDRYRSYKHRPFSTASCENIFIDDFLTSTNGPSDNNQKLMNVEEVNDEVINDSCSNNHIGSSILDSVRMDGILIDSCGNRPLHDHSIDKNNKVTSSIDELYSLEGDITSTLKSDDVNPQLGNLEVEIKTVAENDEKEYSKCPLLSEDGLSVEVVDQSSDINSRDQKDNFQISASNSFESAITCALHSEEIGSPCKERSCEELSRSNSYKTDSNVRIQVLDNEGIFLKALDSVDSVEGGEHLPNDMNDVCESDVYLDICTCNAAPGHEFCGKYSGDKDRSIEEGDKKGSEEVDSTQNSYYSYSSYSVFGFNLSNLCTLC